MKVVFNKFRAVLITLGILIIWVVLEALIYNIFGKGAFTTIIGIGIAFVIGAYFFHVVKKHGRNKANGSQADLPS